MFISKLVSLQSDLHLRGTLHTAFRREIQHMIKDKHTFRQPYIILHRILIDQTVVGDIHQPNGIIEQPLPFEHHLHLIPQLLQSKDRTTVMSIFREIQGRFVVEMFFISQIVTPLFIIFQADEYNLLSLAIPHDSHVSVRQCHIPESACKNFLLMVGWKYGQEVDDVMSPNHLAQS